MSWDIAPTQNQEYFEFVVRVFIPAVQNLGFEFQEAWATAYGDRPQIQVGAVMPDIQQIMRVLRSPEWKELHEQLLYVCSGLPAKNRYEPQPISVLMSLLLYIGTLCFYLVFGQ